jgi:hypothetical protein
MPKLIGLDHLDCIRDIVTGRVALDDVSFICTNARNRTEQDWVLASKEIARVCPTDPKWATNILSMLRREGRLFQPRLLDSSWDGGGVSWINADTHEEYTPPRTKPPMGWR